MSKEMEAVLKPGQTRRAMGLWIVLMAGLGAGCTYSDSERCPDGLFFVQEVWSCCIKGEAIFYQDSQRCHRFTEKNSNKCPTAHYNYYSFSYTEADKEQKQVAICCAPETTFYSEEECEEAFAEEPETMGQGKSCTKDGGECEGYEADYCAVNPVAPAEAYCTTTGCNDSTSCEDGYACCDCSSSTLLPQIAACLKDKDAQLADSVASCDCDI